MAADPDDRGLARNCGVERDLNARNLHLGSGFTISVVCDEAVLRAVRVLDSTPLASYVREKYAGRSLAAACANLGAVWPHRAKRRYCWRLCQCAAILAGAGLVTSADARAADASTPKLTLVPDSVAISDGPPKQILAILHNPQGKALNARLRWTNRSHAVIRVIGGNTRRAFLAPGSEHAWTVLIATPADTTAGTVLFRANGRSAGAHRISVANLKLNSPAPPTLDDVKVEIKTALESLDVRHPGVVYLLVANDSGAPIKINSITGSGPDEVTFDNPKLPVEVPNRHTSSLPITVSAAERVRKGKYLLLFDLGLVSEHAPTDTIHKVITHQAQIGIPGEADVLTLLGIPSLLLIPGVLMLVVLILLWRIPLPRPAGVSPNLPFEEKTIRFWVIAVTLSILMAGIYPHLPGGVDYLDRYSLADVIGVWFASLFIGALLYVVALVIAHIYERVAKWLLRRRTPSATDRPTDLLRKLGRQGLDLRRERYEFTRNSDAHYIGYVVQPRNGEASLWFSPPLVVTVEPGTPNGGELIETLRAEDDPSALAEILNNNPNALRIRYEPSGGPAGPYRKESASLGPHNDTSRMLRVE
jgi:hypothetical protein